MEGDVEIEAIENFGEVIRRAMEDYFASENEVINSDDLKRFSEIGNFVSLTYHTNFLS
jgi:hypothetical protein